MPVLFYADAVRCGSLYMCCSQSGAAAAAAAAAAAIDAWLIEYNTQHMLRVLVDDARIFCSIFWLDAPCPLLKFATFSSE